MTLTRRQTIALIGGGTVAAAGGAAAADLMIAPSANAPWGAAGAYDDARLRALSHAILAPNPHNRQPWMADLREEGVVTLHVDTDRLLPQTDPFSRQIVIGLGCFLGLMEMAAAADGWAVETVAFPEGSDPGRLDARPVARCTFRRAAPVVDPLLAQVPARRSLKEPFDTTRPVAPDTLAPLVAAARHARAGGTVEPGEVAELRALTADALTVEVETPHTFKESVDLFRIGRGEVNANPDGIDFSGPTFQALHRLGLFDRASAMDTTSLGYREGLAAVLANAQTAMGFVWLVTEANGRAAQLDVGRDWLRVNLAATAQGLGFQPLSQALQEYPEVREHYDAIHARLAPAGGTVQMLSRVGYGPDVPASPRWPVEAKVIA
ncbi:MAG: Acg family FMN-binding oxidoreductase [Paracoccaceae bacterium]